MKFNKITLLTDFGDYYPGVMKFSIHSVLDKLNYKADVLDLTHSIEPFNIYHGAFLLLNAYKYLRAVHCAVVDPTVGSSRKAIAIICKNHIFIGPDNGLLYPAAKEAGIKKVYEISEKAFEMLKKATNEHLKLSKTFHGRDIFAPASAFAAAGRIDEVSEEYSGDIAKLNLFDVKIDENQYVCKILYVDNFGNIITNIKRELIEPDLKGFYVSSIYFPIVEKITSVNIGETFAIIGSSDVVELCVRNGSAFDKLNEKIKGKSELKLKPKW